MTDHTTLTLIPEPATAQALAPFGTIIGSASGAPVVPVDFYRGAVRMSYPARFECEHPVDVTLACVSPRAPEVRYMERHFQHTQGFLPLGGGPFVVVMAPPGDGDLPDLAQVRAFHFDGSAGFLMHRGTWHEFPYVLPRADRDETEIVVILSRQTGYDLKAKDATTEEAHGPDLDKKDIFARTGCLIRFEAPPVG